MVLFIIYVFLSSAGLVLFKLGSSSLNIQLQQTIFFNEYLTYIFIRFIFVI